MNFSKLARAGFAVGAVAITVLSLMPADELPSTGMWDKLEHALAYGVLAAVGALGWAGRARAWAVLGASLVALGLVLELLQAVVPGRFTDAGDALANLIGTLLGMSAVAALGRIAGRASRLGQPGR